MKKNKNTITQEQVDDYQFTKKQIAAYEALKKACKRCQDAGLDLVAKQWTIHAFPTKFYEKDMVCSLNDIYNEDTNNPVPYLSGANINDSGADDTEYFKKGVVIP